MTQITDMTAYRRSERGVGQAVEARVRRCRARLDALAEQADGLSNRLSAGVSLAATLTDLAQTSDGGFINEADTGEDGRYISDDWEIALIDDEDGDEPVDGPGDGPRMDEDA